MTRRTFFLSPVLSPIVFPSVAAPVANPLAVTHVSVIDGEGLRQDQTVVLQHDRIVAVGNAATVRVPRDARVLPARGRFLIPGLWDMHVHLSIARASALPVLIANGVTGVRDMGGLPEDLDRWRAGIESGAIAGPRIFRSGPMLNGKSFNNFQIAVENASEARGAVRTLQKSGADFVKVHAAISRDAYLGTADECKKLGIRFSGHLPRVISPEEASDAGQASLEHLYTLFDGTLAAGVEPDNLSETILRFRDHGARELFTRFAKNGTYFTPALVIERASIHLNDPRPSAYDRYISNPARALTQQMQTKYKELFTPAFAARQERQLKASLPLIPLMHACGVRLLTGTDMGSSLLAPGYSLHEELAMLVEAGLPPLEALQAATQAPTQI
jgi:imidazolonepropionase-like amidohydrolase